MTTITNNYTNPLGLPGGQVINPGASDDVPDWEKLKSHGTVAAWVAGGALSEAPQADDNEEKDAIIALLAENGITKDRRTSLEALRALLAEQAE